ncbi:MAG: phage holin family protein [Burkholderiales bacterium]|nr:phage holin family protein [Burkholderiales bacterium]MDE2629202.1 phage holin family protein [Burkholderiales bacterium]
MSRDDPGLLDALTRLSASVVGTLRSRLELASLELGDAGRRLVITIVACVAAVLLLGGAVAVLTAWVAVALWGTLGAAVLGWIALAYALAGAALLLWLRAHWRRAPPLLADTLTELRQDAALARGTPAAREPSERP